MAPALQRSSAARLLSLLLCALAFAALFAPQAADAFTKPAVVKIGAVLPLTGNSAGSGRRAWLLLNQSLAEVTTNLGAATLNGTKLQLVIEDSESTLAGTAAATLRLGNQGVAVVLGGAQGLNLVNNQPVTITPAHGATGVGVGPGSAETSVMTWTAATMPLSRSVIAMSPSACSRRDFRDRTLYPHLNRMCVTPGSKARATLSAFDLFGWKKVAIFAQDDADGWGGNLAAYNDPVGNILGPGQAEADFIVEQLAAKMTAKRAKKDILRLRIPMQPSLARDQIPILLNQLQESGIRIVLVYVQGSMLVELLRLAAGLGMMQYPYVWVGAGANAGPASSNGLGTGTVASGGMGAGLCSNAVIAALADLTPAIPSVASSAGRLVSSFQSSTIGASSSAATFIYQADLALTSSPLMGAICFVPATPSSPAFTNLKYRLQSAQGLPFESILNMADASTYDSLTVVAKAVGSLMAERTEFSPDAAGEAVWSAADMWAAISNSTLVGAQSLSGSVSFDSNGDKSGTMDLLNYDPLGSASGSFVKRAIWNQAANGFNFTDAIIWADATAVLPPDHVDRFEEGQVLTPTMDSRIIALAYFYVLLPSALLIYNTRRSIKSFIDTQGGSGGDRSWVMDHVRAFGFFSVPGVFAMHHLNLLSMSFVAGIGDLSLAQDAFAGGLCLCFLLGVCVAMLPLLLETWWGVRKGGADAAAIAEDFELHMENGEEIAAPAEAAANAKNKDEVKKLAPSAKEKARAARAKARKGGLSSNDEGNIIERELDTLWEKMTPGLVVSAAMFAAIISGLFMLSIQGIILPLTVKIDAGRAFGAWVLETLCMIVIFVRAFKDSRNFARVLSVFLASAVLLMSFHVNLSAVTFRYRAPTEYEEDHGLAGSDAAVDLGAIAIAHAILFAIPFFAGLLQLIKALKLSRHSLDSILGNMKSKLALLEAGLDAAKAERKATAADTDHLKRLLELSNLCRPLHRNHALAFTMAETTGSSGPESGGAGGQEKKPFIPASFTQDIRFGGGARTVQGAVNTPKLGGMPGTPTKAPGGNMSGGPASPSIMDTARTVNMSAVKLVPDTPGGQAGPSAPGTPIRRSAGIGGPSVALSAAASERAANLSQGIAAANLTGLDFGFLARPKAEQTGYKLLNELSLELFLASGPVHHRAVADITLAHVLSHPLTLELFKDSLTRSGSQEAMAFWLDIQRFKQLESEELRKQIAEAMTATFLYSDAPHPVHFLTPASREGVLNVIFAKKPPKRALFHFVEQELLAHLQKEHANFATTTAFKVTAFLLGHSSYRPSTRIKTLNAGGAAVGAGGALVQMTQNQGPAEHSGSNQQGGGGVNASVVMTGAPGAGGIGGGGLGANFDPESSMGPASRMAVLTVDTAKPSGAPAALRKDSSAGGAAATESPKASKLASPQHASGGGASPAGANRGLLMTAAFNAAASSSQPPSPMPRDAPSTPTPDEMQASAVPTVKLHFGSESATDDGVAAAVAATAVASAAASSAEEEAKEKEESRGSEDDETKPLSPKQDSPRRL